MKYEPSSHNGRQHSPNGFGLHLRVPADRKATPQPGAFLSEHVRLSGDTAAKLAHCRVYHNLGVGGLKKFDRETRLVAVYLAWFAAVCPGAPVPPISAVAVDCGLEPATVKAAMLQLAQSVKPEVSEEDFEDEE